ncbi:Chaperone DnaJ-domain superfamily protein [Euphorbia peplus]|nr:Chaperone DnaJ-domain superfamily protein [Euphorbia peplus]
MLGAGTSRSNSFPNTSGKDCRMRRNRYNVIIDVDIDVDADDDSVIFIDEPDTLQEEAKGSQMQSIINIDDDDDESQYSGADDCGVAQGKRPAFKLSKCKNMYTNKSPRTNRYGFWESDSDCEVIEGSSSDLREQWKNVRLNKKSNSYDKASGLQDQVSPCSSQTDGTKHSEEDPFFSRGKNVQFQEASSSYFPATEDSSSFEFDSPWLAGLFPQVDNFSQQSNTMSKKNDVSMNEQACPGDCDFPSNECEHIPGFHDDFGSFVHSPRSIHRSNKKVIGTRNCFQHSKQTTVGEHFFEKSNLNSTKRPCVQDYDKEEAFLCKDQFSGSKPTSMEKDLKFSETTASRNICSNETQNEFLGSEAQDPLNKSISISHEGKSSLNAPCGDVISTVQNDIINEREKLKETDEYKRAVEEEWAARQQQLKIQAEEAQRLKKRRKAETLRILDMERRQKQRVKEVRETQKKDEENLNMKEHLRAEIRKELYRLESTCTDMASLLRGLGIHVEGGFRPLLQQVNAAYKRALLKFHPDRASRTDIRQQVTAEEKFKLMSRMKEKFLPS